MPPIPTVNPNATPNMPGIPRTGHPPEAIIVAPEKPASPGGTLEYLPVSFRLFYDRNGNNLFNAGEGVRGVSIYFTKQQGRRTASGSLTTSGNGFGISKLLSGDYRVVAPYFGLDVPLKGLVGGDIHSIWLPPVTLPSRVP